MNGERRKKLGLGTAQFGLPYGISGGGQRVSPAEARAILETACAHGITLIDTAPAYGQSERVLGELLPDVGEFDIVTKTSALQGERVEAADVDAVEHALIRSLDSLRRSSVYGVLVHRSNDLLVSGGERLYERMVRWRQQGRTRKIGVSVYTRQEIDQLLARYRFDIVQLPISAFDQRLVLDGTVKQLREMGIELHARSVFLQGLMLMSPDELPSGVQAARDILTRFRERAAEAHASPLAAALGYVAGLSEIDRVVIGVHSTSHLRECVAAIDEAARLSSYADLRCADENIIDPRRWPT